MAEQQLNRSLGFWGVFALTITSMVGTSLFFGIATGAKIAGPASILSWILLGVITIYVAACMGELISMFPTSGGVYEFTKQAFGRFPSFLIGWMAWMVSNVGSAVAAVAALDFILPGSGWITLLGFKVSYSTIKFVAAIFTILLFNYVTFLGIQASGALIMIFAAIVLGLLVAIMIPGFSTFHASNFHPFFTAAPWLTLVVIFFIIESFFGWESASFLAEETKDPEKTIPRALIAASVTVVILGVLFAFMMLGAFSSSALGSDANPVITLVTHVLPVALPVLLVGVFLTFMAGVMSNTISSPRLLFALARDRLFVEQCTKLHPKYKTPVNAIIFQTVVTMIVVLFAFGSYQHLLGLLVPLALVMYAIVLLAIPVLRRHKPNHPRPFKVWGGSWLPAVIAALYIMVIVCWAVTDPAAASAITLIIGFILLSFPIFLFVTMVYNPDAIISVNNAAASLNYFLEDVLFPKSVRQEIISIFKRHLRGKDVLEFGAGVGTFTTHLAEAVGPQGSITAVDLSRSNLDILLKRVKKEGNARITVIHDEHQINRVHPDIKRADVVYSIGFLGYVQDLHKVLREMHSVLSPNGKICFVEYTNFFKILPDPAIVADEEALAKIFAECGFAVSIKKRKGFLWNYLIIEGIKSEKAVPYI